MRKSALMFVVLLGIVSLFADVTYEGARSITGPFLATLGASGTIVGVVVGIGELFGYGFRSVFGYITDKLRMYWTIMFLGYAINLIAVPMLALAGNWQMAGLLIILERFGKAMRVPARDAMLSFATKRIGRGFGFGLHESLDQIGAVIGPLLLATVLGLKESYRFGFALLLIPALLALFFLGLARRSYPRPQELEVKKFDIATKGFVKPYWIYITAVAFVAAGYVDFALISYHFQQDAVFTQAWIPFLYAIAMAVSGISSLFMGRWYDKRGIGILTLLTAASALFAPLVFWGSVPFAVAGMVLWGIGLGSQESVMRAVIPSLAPPERRGRAYGLMNLFYGVSWAIGSGVKGLFYDISFTYLVAFSLLCQFIAVLIFLKIKIQIK